MDLPLIRMTAGSCQWAYSLVRLLNAGAATSSLLILIHTYLKSSLSRAQNAFIGTKYLGNTALLRVIIGAQRLEEPSFTN